MSFTGLGIAPTGMVHDSLIGHRHITVNGKVVNIPSMELKPGDIVAVRERSKSLEVITEFAVVTGQTSIPGWNGISDMMTGKFMNYPERDQIPENIREQLIVELYSK